MSDELLDELLAKPVGPVIRGRSAEQEDFTRQIEVTGNTGTVIIKGAEGTIDEGTALDYLNEEGLSHSEWEVTGFKKSKYGTPDNPLEAVSFTFKKRAAAKPVEDRLNIDELVADIRDYSPVDIRPVGSHGFVVLIGDMQFGKIDGDGAAGTIARTIAAINQAADKLLVYRKLYDVGHVHIAWLGDHVEGFTSQGGANVWRTTLTMNEQIRLTRRVMLHALKVFAPLAQLVTMAAVPGNHGEPVRFSGTGITRYDDSHDTESLIAVKDAADLMPEAFGHVQFFVPDTDELIVMVDVARTTIAHHHGHKWRPGKQFEWWQGQAFNRDSAMHVADVLVAGHLHHEHYECDGDRTYWGINALESDSTWFRHLKGTGGSPGIHVGIVKDGQILTRETLHAA